MGLSLILNSGGALEEWKSHNAKVSKVGDGSALVHARKFSSGISITG